MVWPAVRVLSHKHTHSLAYILTSPEDQQPPWSIRIMAGANYRDFQALGADFESTSIHLAIPHPLGCFPSLKPI